MHDQFGANGIVFFFAKCVMVVGILPLIAITVHAMRRFTVTASSSSLSVVRQGVFGSRLQNLDRKQIRDVGVESSGLQVNARLYWHLAIHATDQAKAFTSNVRPRRTRDRLRGCLNPSRHRSQRKQPGRMSNRAVWFSGLGV